MCIECAERNNTTRKAKETRATDGDGIRCSPAATKHHFRVLRDGGADNTRITKTRENNDLKPVIQSEFYFDAIICLELGGIEIENGTKIRIECGTKINSVTGIGMRSNTEIIFESETRIETGAGIGIYLIQGQVRNQKRGLV
ncbi:hypothetical protein EVAR_37163_1 [Eumeta japonica]|uniref:Uncharacterized protein n=1 Tax=Eumeta variegata TaxID=151549 RepID=A0A4C1WHT8_EUMVA|nr:hypothetical protein EVAR_37163_1 [Eumeta japonica]